eukprot:Hpha_TRINITY_DN16834_c4_g8::TRINITY_DN16834_c4_g8_i1::g.152308::m.152308
MPWAGTVKRWWSERLDPAASKTKRVDPVAPTVAAPNPDNLVHKSSRTLEGDTSLAMVMAWRGAAELMQVLQGRWYTRAGTRVEIQDRRVRFGSGGTEALHIGDQSVVVLGVGLNLHGSDTLKLSWNDGDVWTRSNKAAPSRPSSPAPVEEKEVGVSWLAQEWLLAPQMLYISSREQTDIAGSYHRLHPLQHNEMPLWSSGDNRLYSSSDGFWMVADRRKVADELCVLCSRFPHKGVLPDLITEWVHFKGDDGSSDGWAPCECTAILRRLPSPVPSPVITPSPLPQLLRPPLSPEEGFRPLPTRKKAPPASPRRLLLRPTGAGILSSPTSKTDSSGGSWRHAFEIQVTGWEVGGVYSLVAGYKVQGFPTWRSEEGNCLFSTACGRWAISASERDIEEARYIAITNETHGGDSPNRVDGWRHLSDRKDLHMTVAAKGSERGGSVRERSGSTQTEPQAQFALTSPKLPRRRLGSVRSVSKPTSGSARSTYQRTTSSNGTMDAVGVLGVAWEEGRDREAVESSEGLEREAQLLLPLLAVLAGEASRLYDLWADAQDDIRRAVDACDPKGVSDLVPDRDDYATRCARTLATARNVLVLQSEISGNIDPEVIRGTEEDLYFMTAMLQAFFDSKSEAGEAESMLSGAEFEEGMGRRQASLTLVEAAERVPEAGMCSVLSPRRHHASRPRLESR